MILYKKKGNSDRPDWSKLGVVITYTFVTEVLVLPSGLMSGPNNCTSSCYNIYSHPSPVPEHGGPASIPISHFLICYSIPLLLLVVQLCSLLLHGFFLVIHSPYAEFAHTPYPQGQTSTLTIIYLFLQVPNNLVSASPPQKKTYLMFSTISNVSACLCKVINSIKNWSSFFDF